MAHSPKYQYTAHGLREASYIVELEKEGYTGGVTEVQRDSQAVTLFAGRGAQAEMEPLMPSRALLAVRAPSIIEEIHGSGDTVWRASIYRKPENFPRALYWRGYIPGDLGRIDDGQHLPPAQIEAIDGLEYLRNIQTSTIPGNASIESRIRVALQDIDLGLDWWVQFPWVPRLDQTADAEFTEAEDVSRYLRIGLESFQEDRSLPEGEGDYLSQYDMLREVLKTFHLRLTQYDGKWWLRSRHVARYGQRTAHRYSPGGSAVQASQLMDFRRDLNTLDVEVEKGAYRWLRNVGTASAEHNFGPYLGSGLQNGSFEDEGVWTYHNPTDQGGGEIEYQSLRVDKTNPPAWADSTPQEATANDRYYNVHGIGSNIVPGDYPLVTSPVIQYPGGGDPRQIFTLRFGAGVDIRSTLRRLYVKVEKNGHWLSHFNTGITGESLPGEDITLSVDPLPVAIPKGARVKIFDQTNRQDEIATDPVLTLTQEAKAGDTQVVGDLDQALNTSNYTTPILRHYGWKDTESKALFDQFTPESINWQTIELMAYMVTDGGNVVEGPNLQVEFGFNAFQGFTGAFLESGIDNVEVEITRDGNRVSSEIHTVTTGEPQSEAQTITGRLGDGPSSDSSARVYYEDIDNERGGGEQNSLNEWARTPFTGAETGTRLGWLRAEEVLREFREKQRRRTLRLHLTAPDKIGPQHLIEWDGKVWAIEQWEHNPYGGYFEVTVVPVQDHGLAGTSRSSGFEIEGTGGDGTSGGASGGGGSGSLTGPYARTDIDESFDRSVEVNTETTAPWTKRRTRNIFAQEQAPSGMKDGDVWFKTPPSTGSPSPPTTPAVTGTVVFGDNLVESNFYEYDLDNDLLDHQVTSLKNSYNEDASIRQVAPHRGQGVFYLMDHFLQVVLGTPNTLNGEVMTYNPATNTFTPVLTPQDIANAGIEISSQNLSVDDVNDFGYLLNSSGGTLSIWRFSLTNPVASLAQHFALDNTYWGTDTNINHFTVNPSDQQIYLVGNRNSDFAPVICRYDMNGANKAEISLNDATHYKVAPDRANGGVVTAAQEGLYRTATSTLVGTDFAYQVAVDEVNGRIYYLTGNSAEILRSVALNGTNQQTHYTRPDPSRVSYGLGWLP